MRQLPVAMACPRVGPAPCRPLWALDDLLRDVVLGTCLPPGTVRDAIAAGGLPEGTVVPDDHTLHMAVVARCSQANALSRALQRLLEGCHAAMAQRFAREAGDAARLLELWRRTAFAGGPASALWACATHPLCDDALAGEVRRDLLLLQLRAPDEGRQGHAVEGVHAPRRAPVSGRRGHAARPGRRGPPRSPRCTA